MRLLGPIIASLLIVSFAHADDVLLPAMIRSPQGASHDIFGADLALASPERCFVGVRGADERASNAGAVDAFELTVSGWRFLERLAPVELAAGDQFGEVVAATADWLAVGAPRHDAAGADAGAVWLYHRNGYAWTEVQRLVPPAGSAGHGFGSSIAIGAGVLAIGSPLAGVGGTVTVYSLSGLTWSNAKLIANPTAAADDRFGEAVAFVDATLFVGDPFDNAGAIDRGTVFAYETAGRDWQLIQQLAPATTEDRQYFGNALASDSTQLAASAHGADASGGTIASSGRVEIFERVGAAWTRRASILPPSPAADANFGWDLSIDGDRIVVGEPARNGAIAAELMFGQAHLYRRVEGAWSVEATFRHVAPQAYEVLGTAVAMRGGRVVAAAPGRDSHRGALITADFARDCNSNSIVDVLEIAGGAADCNGDLVPDSCQPDTDGDGVPNACDCPYDLNGDGLVSSPDLTFVLTYWGSYGQWPSDLNGDLRVGAPDITLILSSWGICP